MFLHRHGDTGIAYFSFITSYLHSIFPLKGLISVFRIPSVEERLSAMAIILTFL